MQTRHLFSSLPCHHSPTPCSRSLLPPRLLGRAWKLTSTATSVITHTLFHPFTLFQELASTEAARSGLEADLASTTARLDETAEALALKEAELEGTTAQLEQQLEVARAEVRSTGRGTTSPHLIVTQPRLY